MTIGAAKGDPNIYGPGGVNLGPNGNPNQLFQEIEQQRLQQEAVDEPEPESGLRLRQQRGGHYFVDGRINNFPLAFVIDTGASVVALPKQAARKAGIECESDALMETANGTVSACTCMIPKLKFGDFSITEVRCLIAPNLNHALLGNNVLKEFKILQQNGELRIERR